MSPMKKYVLGVDDAVFQLRDFLAHHDKRNALDNFDHPAVIHHYVDCYLYGSAYENATAVTDPLDWAFIIFEVPLFYRSYIQDSIRTECHRLVDRVLTLDRVQDETYYVSWPYPTTGIIEAGSSLPHDLQAM